MAEATKTAMLTRLAELNVTAHPDTGEPLTDRLRRDEIHQVLIRTLSERKREQETQAEAAAELDTALALEQAVREHPASVNVEPSAEVAIVEPASTLPTPSRWEQIREMATVLASSDLVPSALRGKPADILVVLLAANDVGITPTIAFQKIAVIDAKPTMSAELMRMLVRRDGHSISVEVLRDEQGRPTEAEAKGKRLDNGDTGTVTYSVADAVAAGLCKVDDNGDVRARSSRGNPLPWEAYTEDMLVARATSRLCRRLFEDSLGGISYTPEELKVENVGGWGDGDGSPVEPSPRRDEIAALIKALPDEARDALKAEWLAAQQERVMHSPANLMAGEEEQALALIAKHTPAPVAEAEVVLYRERAEELLLPCSECGAEPGDQCADDCALVLSAPF